ncbi:dihydrolipoamide acetyltransferase family protein [Petroclostridium sp. X23]|uniref:dihydrolipoamide acetyltransferase family protein n=1 Tax=Petroclostridium sp. X23 TaxID=3045146 RepID=UPI0024AE5580|nr:dihydrolipoamide acetyltransferase family protein [Petroclostridium sp. X23]WHH57031.1 dihydrolipoamide acetyltransferase family protein [Petroclostridium sp. X23]
MANIVNMPRLSLNEDSNLLTEWLVNEGDSVKEGDGLFSIETDKSSLVVYSDFTGIVLKKYYNDYEVVQALTPVCVIGHPGEEIPELSIEENTGINSEKAEEKASEPVDVVVPSTDIPVGVPADHGKISPRARRLAEANGIEIKGIIPSGAENRIIEADIIAAMTNGKTDSVKKKENVKKLPKIRQVIAKNMMNSLQNSAQLTNVSIFNISAILDYRERCKKDEKLSGITIGDMINYVVAKTLSEFPYINAHMVSDTEVVEYGEVNLGVAVDTERGLMVPTIADASKKSLSQISAELKSMATECQSGKISPEKLSGGTFTVSNLGALGIRMFTPILNPPQVGILGVGCTDYAMKKTKEGILYYPSCTLSLTYDHRVVDGAPASRFLKKLCENLENFEQYI